MRFRYIGVLLGALWLFHQPLFGQTEDLEAGLGNLNWIEGPETVHLGTEGELRIPEGFIFLNGTDTRKFIEAIHEISSGLEVGMVGPLDGEWFVTFDFNPLGYVPDDEKDSLDADVILKSYQDGTEEANKEKVRRGWNNLLTVDGWTLRPTYNTTTNNLEWAINVRGSEGAAVNYETRLLGRRGVMSVTLVCDPDALNQILPSYRSLIGGFQYKAGGKYADFRSGDKIAQYGLSALIVGGAAAAASKSGLAKALGKGVFAFFAAIAVAIGGFLKKIWAYVTHGSSGN